MKHSFYSQDTEALLFNFNKINQAEAKRLIIDHLTEHPTDCIEHKINGEVVDFYEVNKKSGIPSKVMLKGGRCFYKPLIDPELPF